MNWYKKAGIINPNPQLVQWMVNQVKPYVQTMLTNKRIKELKEDKRWIENTTSYNQKVLKNPKFLEQSILFPTDNSFTPQQKQDYYVKELEKIKIETPAKEKELQTLNERLEALLSIPKVKFPAVKERLIEIKVPEELVPKDLKELMIAINRPIMKLVIHYGISGASGTYDKDYDRSSVAIEIDLMKITKNPYPYQDIVETVSHELVHNIQHLMGGKYGLPSKHISTPEYTNEKYWDISSRSKKSYLYHSLLDTEFYPRLADRAAKLNELRKNHPEMTMESFKGFIERDSWLKILKEHAVEKYHKAVNELLKVFQKNS